MNHSCVHCNVDGYVISGSQCLPCDSTCLTCNGTAPDNCLTCVSGKYFFPDNNTCLDCTAPGYFINQETQQCDICDSSCKTCNEKTPTSCLSCYQGYYFVTSNNSCSLCKDIPGYYANDVGQTCDSVNAVNVIKFDLQEPPQLYIINFDVPFDLESAQGEIRLYQLTSSDANSPEMSFSLRKISSTSYELNFRSYTESNETRSLLLSFELFNKNTSNAYKVLPTTRTAPIITDSSALSSALAVGSSSQAVFITTAAASLLFYLQSKGKSPQLMRILQIMARITYMKLIDVNYLTPLASFYNYTDLGQFGLPNFFKNIDDSTAPSNRRILDQSTENITTSNGLFTVNPEGSVVYNGYYTYTFSQVFLDGYGGIIFSSCITFTLYLAIKVISPCFKNENSKIKQLLIKLAQSFERSLVMTILVSRYMYLCSSLTFNYVFCPLNGIYQIISFIFAILWTILLLVILLLALAASFYHGENKAKMKMIRPVLNVLAILLHDYHAKRWVGRVFTFWILLSNIIIVLALQLLGKWPLAQLGVLIGLSVVTIILSLPTKVFKTTANKIIMIGTETGFIIINILLIVMYLLQDSGSSYQIRVGLSWTAVGVNIAIIVFQILVKIAEFFRLRKKKKEEEARKKKEEEMRRKTTQNCTDESNLHGRTVLSSSIDANDSHLIPMRSTPEPYSFDQQRYTNDIPPKKSNRRSQHEAFEVEDTRTHFNLNRDYHSREQNY